MKILVLALILVLSLKAFGASDCKSRLELLNDPMMSLVISLVRNNYVTDSTRSLLAQGIIPPVEKFEFKGLNEGQILSYRRALSLAGSSKIPSNTSEILKLAIEDVNQNKADMGKTKESTKSIWHQPVYINHRVNSLDVAKTSLRVLSNGELLLLTNEEVPGFANQVILKNVELRSAHIAEAPGKDFEIVSVRRNHIIFFNSKGEDIGSSEMPRLTPETENIYIEPKKNEKLTIRFVPLDTSKSTYGIFDMSQRHLTKLPEKSFPLIFLPDKTIIKKLATEKLHGMFGNSGTQTQTSLVELETGQSLKEFGPFEHLRVLQGKNNGYFLFNEGSGTKIYDAANNETKDFNFRSRNVDNYGVHINPQGEEVFYLRIIKKDSSSSFVAWNSKLNTFENLGDIRFNPQYHTTLPSGHFFAAASGIRNNAERYLSYFHSGLGEVREFRIPESFSIIGAQETADQLILLGRYDEPQAPTQLYMAFELYGPNHK